MNWLMTRTPRERWLVLIMGSMLIIFIGWQFAIKPVLDMRANSRTAQAAAIRDYDIVRIGLPKLRPQSATNKASCLLYTSPSPRDQRGSRMPSSA